MNLTNKISLDAYYSQTQKCFYFFDGLMNLSKETQTEIFNELKIKQSTYRAYRKLGKDNDNVEIIKRLSDYFKCSDVNKLKQTEMENLINEILYCVFYKVRDKVLELSNKIQEYIEYNTMLKPVLVLFKVLLKAFNSECYDDLYELNEEIIFLNAFSKLDYFTDDLYYIFKSILYFYNKNEDVKYLEENANKYNKLSWIYYNLRAMKAYYEDDSEEAKSYYLRVLKIYEESYSLERVMMVINIIAAENNNIGKYYFALEECLKVLDYAYSLADQRQAINLSLHYVYAKYQLNEYKDIIEFYYQYFKRLNDYNYVAVVVIMLTAYKLKRNDVIDELFNNYNNEYLLAFYKYINDNDDSLISKLKHSSYSQKLYLELKSIINTKK